MTDSRLSIEATGLPPLPEGDEIIGLIALIKTRRPDGELSWSFRTSEVLTEEETLGALTVRTELEKLALLEFYSPVASSTPEAAGDAVAGDEPQDE